MRPKLGATVGLALLLGAPAMRASGQSCMDTTRVSLSSSEGQGNDNSYDTSLSETGRYVAFHSWATNLVEGDTNGRLDVFVHDRVNGETERISIRWNGPVLIQGNNNSWEPSISADGRYVAFHSLATNLHPQASVYTEHVLVHDRVSEQLEYISIPMDGTVTGRSKNPDITADGSTVVFWSYADNLVPGDTNDRSDIYLRDRAQQQTVRVSLSTEGLEPNGNCFSPTVSDDGRVVAFDSGADNLVPDDSNGAWDIFVHEVDTGVTTRASVNSQGEEADASSGHPFLSGDGRYVAFSSSATNLDGADGNYQTYVHDRQTGQTRMVSVTPEGAAGNGSSSQARLSPDGRFAVFRSHATDLVEDDTNGFGDVFIRDRLTETTRLVSRAADGQQANAHSGWATSLAPQGDLVAFTSDATNLVEDDTNDYDDVFVRTVSFCTGGDVNCDSAVNVLDFLTVLAAWGACPPAPERCPADDNGDGTVGVPDLLAVLLAWGRCL